MAKGKGEVKGWITRNGVHVPIYDNYTVRGGEEPKAKGSKFKGAGKKRKKVDTSTTSGKTANDLNSNLKKKGLELDSADLSSMAHKDFNDEKVTMYDKDGNTYEGTYNKYKNGDREIVDIKKTGGRDTGKSEASKANQTENAAAGKTAQNGAPRVTDEEAKSNKVVEWEGQKYSTQPMIDWDNAKNEEYVAGHLYVPIVEHGTGKDAHQFFVANEDGSVHNSGSEYLRQKSSKPAITPTSSKDAAAKKEGFLDAEDKELFEAREKAYETRGLRGQAEKEDKYANRDWSNDLATAHQAGYSEQKELPKTSKEWAKHINDKYFSEYPNYVKAGSIKSDASEWMDTLKENGASKEEIDAFNAFVGGKKQESSKPAATPTSAKESGSTKEAKGSIPTTVSGLRSAYSEAMGSEKAAIASELRKKGYSLIGGKWVKGK